MPTAEVINPVRLVAIKNRITSQVWRLKGLFKNML
jgi:hypothetical protein